jgi:hypothetical protein
MTEQAEKQNVFRVFCYFRLFRHLSCSLKD